MSFWHKVHQHLYGQTGSWIVKHMPVTSCALSGHTFIQIFLLPHTYHTARAAHRKHAALRVSRHDFGGYQLIVSAVLKPPRTNCQQGLRGWTETISWIKGILQLCHWQTAPAGAQSREWCERITDDFSGTAFIEGRSQESQECCFWNEW